jgi:hypothetical protein
MQDRQRNNFRAWPLRTSELGDSWKPALPYPMFNKCRRKSLRRKD